MARATSSSPSTRRGPGRLTRLGVAQLRHGSLLHRPQGAPAGAPGHRLPRLPEGRLPSRIRSGSACRTASALMRGYCCPGVRVARTFCPPAATIMASMNVPGPAAETAAGSLASTSNRTRGRAPAVRVRASTALHRRCISAVTPSAGRWPR